MAKVIISDQSEFEFRIVFPGDRGDKVVDPLKVMMGIQEGVASAKDDAAALEAFARFVGIADITTCQQQQVWVAFSKHLSDVQKKTGLTPT